MADIIIKNAYVLTMDPDKGDIESGVVVIEDGIITEVGSSTESTAEKIIDAREGVVMPGLVNTHCHAGMTLFRGYADDMPLKEWLEDHIWPAEAQAGDEDIYGGTLVACLEMIRSGTTAFADMYIHMDMVAQAVEESGMRAALSYGMLDFGDTEKADAELKKGTEFVREWNGKADGRITTMYGPHAPNTCSRDFLIRVKEQAVRDNAGIHIHVLETEAELDHMKENFGMCSIHFLKDIDFWGPDVLAAHCVWLSDGDIRILAEHKVNISHNVISNMKLASGIAPVAKLLSAGANVTLGTDGCASNNNLDMFEEMKTAALLQKVSTMDPTVLPASQVLEMATVNGAKALSINSGMLKEGYNADIIIVDMKQPHLSPAYDIASHMVYAANGKDVKTTIVNGKILMEDHEITCLDEQSILERMKRISKNLVSRINS
ncbi:amidohydrolase family protein [Methanolobus halotolerans]|uniref:5'-deoxyadenosine deaminase n=1 Tax=Methanolobus halotolerans TaxID=2052935 RepID=A0A4E0Q006_9EURY|nr:amidohydrolase family protein [Methanolobus halotolerans]TGC11347.1 N-ethylammeline chlorohydrolase [Methanolobus halotolerans]